MLRLALLILGATVTVTHAQRPGPNTTICYDVVGCFDNNPPFDNANNLLPASPAFIGTEFLLYTPQDPNSNSTSLDYTDPNAVLATTFSDSLPLKIIIHGFQNTKATEWIHLMKNELMRATDMNVLIVAWGNGAKSSSALTFDTDYGMASANIRVVAKQIAILLNNIFSVTQLKPSQVHMIGHSLGAHCGGLVGDQVVGIGRITGLDPAEPYFEWISPRARLDRSDAKFVDVIHTNGANIGSSAAGFGLYQDIGHIDFYPNGGKVQRGCKTGITHITDSCSHSRAQPLFTESINTPTPFAACRCDSEDDFNNGKCYSCGKRDMAVMGYLADMFYAPAAGLSPKFFLVTRDSAPYGGVQYEVNILSSNRSADTKGNLSIQLTGDRGQSAWELVFMDSEVKASRPYRFGLVVQAQVGQIRSISLRFDRTSTGFWFIGNDKKGDIWPISSITLKGLQTSASFSCGREVDLETTKPSVIDPAAGRC